MKPPKFFLLLAAICTSLSSIFIRFSSMPPLVISLYRMAAASIIMLAITVIRDRKAFRGISRRDLLLCMLSGFALALHFATWIASISLTTIAASTVLVSCSPIFVALSESLISRRPPGRALVLCLMASIGGTVLIAFGAGASDGLGSVKGNMLALAGGIFVSAYIMLGSRVRRRVPVYTYASLVYSFSTVFLLIGCLFTNQPLAPYPATDFGVIIGLTVVCTVGGHTIYNMMLEHYNPVLISLCTLCEPVFASIMALIVFREIPGLTTVLGSLLILITLALYLIRADSGAAQENK